jgi:hypothetical protein
VFNQFFTSVFTKENFFNIPQLCSALARNYSPDYIDDLEIGESKVYEKLC